MNITAEEIWSAVQAIREKAPVVHSITNYVVMNSTANALLALGASPDPYAAARELDDIIRAALAKRGLLREK